MLPLHQPGSASEGSYAPSLIPRCKCVGLTVTVRAQHAQVLQPVVVPHAVNVVQLNHERLPLPLGQSAYRTDVFEKAGSEEVLFDGAAVLGLSQDLHQRPAVTPSAERASANGLRPRGCGEAESSPAFAVRVPAIVVHLNGSPIDRRSLKRRAQTAKPDRLVPGADRKAELFDARVSSVSAIVEPLHLVPVVPSSLAPPHAVIVAERCANSLTFTTARQTGVRVGAPTRQAPWRRSPIDASSCRLSFSSAVRGRGFGR